MGSRVPRANGHFITLVQFLQQPAYLPWIVLTIAVHQGQDLTARRAGTAFDRCAIAKTLRVLNHHRTSLFGSPGRRVS